MPLPHDRVMSVQVQIGQSAIHIGSEFPAAGILSPRSIGGTATVLQITTEAAEALWRQALDAGAESFTRSPSSSGVSSTDSSAIRSATAGTSLRSSAMSRRTRSPRQRRRSSASRPPAAGAVMAERARILAVTDEGVASFGLSGSPDIQAETHLAGSGARCIAADPADPRRVYVGTVDRGLYLSQDAGETWRQAGPGIGDPRVLSVAVRRRIAEPASQWCTRAPSRATWTAPKTVVRAGSHCRRCTNCPVSRAGPFRHAPGRTTCARLRCTPPTRTGWRWGSSWVALCAPSITTPKPTATPTSC